MSYYDLTTREHRGFTITVSFDRDDFMSPPWKEHDGHGIVSEYVRRDKKPGERTLYSDRSTRRFYDVAETMEIARRDGWGIDDECKAALAKKLGRAPTKGEITAAAVGMVRQQMGVGHTPAGNQRYRLRPRIPRRNRRHAGDDQIPHAGNH